MVAVVCLSGEADTDSGDPPMSCANAARNGDPAPSSPKDSPSGPVCPTTPSPDQPAATPAPVWSPSILPAADAKASSGSFFPSCMAAILESVHVCLVPVFDVVDGLVRDPAKELELEARRLQADLQKGQHTLVGSGSFGHVYKARLRGRVVAVKKLRKFEAPERREFNMLRDMQHDNVIAFIGMYVEHERTACLVMEYARYGALTDTIRESEMRAEHILDFSMQISLGMRYLHEEVRITHRDLKSQNILVCDAPDQDGYRLKISDFGTCRTLAPSTAATAGSQQQQSMVGTVAWMAPEVIRQEPATAAVDTWSAGVVYWELLTGEVPYNGIPTQTIIFNVGSYNASLHVPESCPDGWRSLLSACWAVSASRRPSFSQIIERLAGIRDSGEFTNMLSVATGSSSRSSGSHGSSGSSDDAEDDDACSSSDADCGSSEASSSTTHLSLCEARAAWREEIAGSFQRLRRIEDVEARLAQWESELAQRKLMQENEVARAVEILINTYKVEAMCQAARSRSCEEWGVAAGHRQKREQRQEERLAAAAVAADDGGARSRGAFAAGRVAKGGASAATGAAGAGSSPSDHTVVGKASPGTAGGAEAGGNPASNTNANTKNKVTRGVKRVIGKLNPKVRSGGATAVVVASPQRRKLPGTVVAQHTVLPPKAFVLKAALKDRVHKLERLLRPPQHAQWRTRRLIRDAFVLRAAREQLRVQPACPGKDAHVKASGSGGARPAVVVGGARAHTSSEGGSDADSGHGTLGGRSSRSSSSSSKQMPQRTLSRSFPSRRSSPRSAALSGRSSNGVDDEGFSPAVVEAPRPIALMDARV